MSNLINPNLSGRHLIIDLISNDYKLLNDTKYAEEYMYKITEITKMQLVIPVISMTFPFNSELSGFVKKLIKEGTTSPIIEEYVRYTLMKETDDVGVSSFGIWNTSHCSGHCVTEDTEILTEEGWKKYYEVKENENIMTYNIESDYLEYQKIEKMNIFDYNGVIHSYRSKYVDMDITPKHNCLVKTYKNDCSLTDLYLRKSENLPIQFKIPVCSKYNGEYFEEYSDDVLRLLAWIITEGSFHKLHDGITIYQSVDKKQKYVDEIDELLKKLNISHSRKIKTSNHHWKPEEIKNICVWSIHKEDALEIRNIIPNKEIPREFVNLNPHQAEIFIETLIKGDGTFYSTYKYFTQKNKKTMDIMQEILFKNNKRNYLRNRFNKDKNIYDLTFDFKGPKKENVVVLNKNKHFKETNYIGKVFCPTVKNKTWVARKNDKIFITGNSWSEYDYLSLDLYSCNDFNITPVVDFTKDYYNAKRMDILNVMRYIGKPQQFEQFTIGE